jgi:hypothetical protein
MVNGPPCGICGFTLRWLPQQASWGCDRCQRMFPASGQGAPQQVTSPQSPHAMQNFAPPQQQGFGAPQRPPQQPQGFAPPQHGFQPPQQQGFQPGSSQSHPAHGRQPSHPPGVNPYAPPGAQPSHPPGPNPYAPPGAQGYGAHAQSHPPGANPYAPPGANPYAPPGAQPAGASPYAPPGAHGHAQAHPPGANPYGQPQQAYSPHPATPAPAPVAGKKSSKGLLIGAGVAGLAIAGGVIAFVVMRGGGGTAGGDSRTAVVKSTLAALGDGDVDQLMKLSDVEGLYAKVFDCEGKTKPRSNEDKTDDTELTEKDKEDRDPKKESEKRKKTFEELVPLTKGAKIELVEIVTKEPDAPKDDTPGEDEQVRKTGQKLMKGCVAKVPLRVHAAQVKLKVTPKGEAVVEQDSEIVLMQVGSGFYLVSAPPVSLGLASLEREFNSIKDKVCACKDAECASTLKAEFKASPRSKQIKKQIKALSKSDQDKLETIEDEIKACEQKLGGEEQLEAMVQFKDKLCACNDKVCADKVTQEMTVWGNSNKDAKLSDEDMQKASAIGDEMGKCVTRIYAADTGGGDQGGGGIGATIATAGGVAEAATGLPSECADYREEVLKVANCPKLDQKTRQQLLDSWKTMAEAWRNLDMKTLPPASVKAIEDACKQGADAMKKMHTQLKC